MLNQSPTVTGGGRVASGPQIVGQVQRDDVRAKTVTFVRRSVSSLRLASALAGDARFELPQSKWPKGERSLVAYALGSCRDI